jgi:tRNA nucleotidyltransferase (CCA-adding enzyme)
MSHNLQKGTVYLVGGAVRDELLGRSVNERDWVVVGASPEEMVAAGFVVVGKDFPVFLHPETKEEYALARTERKTGVGYGGFSFNTSPTITLEEDLKRRDLTINAIAKTEQGQLVDPYGGVADLKARHLRHVSSAFTEDPLRVLRVARFAARYFSLGFYLVPETLQLMREIVKSGELKHLAAERVWQETLTALTETHPRIYFEVLRNCGALEQLFPELANLYGVPNPLKWHPEIDSGVHTMMVLDAAVALSPDPQIRLAALLHDLGKALTPSQYWPKHAGHEEKSVQLIQDFCERWRVPKDFKEFAILVARYHGISHKVFELKPSTLIEKLERLDAYRRPQRFYDFLLACQADHHGRTGHRHAPYPQADYWQAAYEATKTIDTKSLLAQGLEGAAIAKAIFSRREQAVTALQAEYLSKR